jgi:hypothetical protein
MIFRWLRAESAPVPDARVVALADVLDAVPPGAPRITAEHRHEELSARRAGVERRFVR